MFAPPAWHETSRAMHARGPSCAHTRASRPGQLGPHLCLPQRRASRASQQRRYRASLLTRAVMGGQAAEALDEGKRVYASGGRAAALKLFESALRTMEPPPEVRRELLYSCGCCHAAFGDVDNAWMCIRDAIEMGLDYNSIDQDPQLLRMEAAPQVRIQLRKYADGRIKSSGVFARQQFEASREASRSATSGAPPKRAGVPSLKDLEVSSDTDDSIIGIIKRVALLLLVGVGLSSVLFFAGLQTLR